MVDMFDVAMFRSFSSFPVRWQNWNGGHGNLHWLDNRRCIQRLDWYRDRDRKRSRDIVGLEWGESGFHGYWNRQRSCV